jgi:hypothetical protein
VPRKSMMASANIHAIDWRSVVALLGDMPRSLPVNGAKSVGMVAKLEPRKESPQGQKMELELEGLVEAGKGRRGRIGESPALAAQQARQSRGRGQR